MPYNKQNNRNAYFESPEIHVHPKQCFTKCQSFPINQKQVETLKYYMNIHELQKQQSKQTNNFGNMQYHNNFTSHSNSMSLDMSSNSVSTPNSEWNYNNKNNNNNNDNNNNSNSFDMDMDMEIDFNEDEIDDIFMSNVPHDNNNNNFSQMLNYQSHLW